MPQRDEQSQRVIQLWVDYARTDLIIARSEPAEGAMPAVYAFHAQQAAEKALKAVLIYHGIDPPRTHNIRDLIALIDRDTPSPVPTNLHDAAHGLTQYAVESRYPDVLGDVPRRDVRVAVGTASELYDWALGILGLP